MKRLIKYFFSKFQIRVICTDHGDPPLSTTSPEIKIQVLDVNDNDPEFQKNITSVSIKENQNYTLLTKVKATDRDSEATIRYNISDISGKAI